MSRNLLPVGLAAATAVLAGAWLLRRGTVPSVTPAVVLPNPVRVAVPEVASARSPAPAPPPAVPVPAEVEAPAADDGRLRLEDVAKRLAALGNWKDRHDLLRIVNRLWGTAGLLRAFDDWIALVGDAKTPERGPLHAWRSATRFHSGDREGAMKDIVELVPAVDVSWAKDEAPYPLLLAFSAGYNAGIHPWAQSGSWVADLSLVSSVGGMLGPDTNSTGVLPFDEREAYVRWVLDLADSAKEPELAMAASIWGHALSLWTPGMKQGLPPAAHRLAARLLPHEDPPEDPGAWVTAQRRFDRAVDQGVHEKDGASLRYREWVARGDALRERTSGREPTWSTWYDPICWSLHEEVVVRFAAADSEKAKALRALAARLLE